MIDKEKAVIILSGGMDSVTVLAYAIKKGFSCYTLTFDYGQKSKSEIEAASYYSNYYKCNESKIFKIDFSNFSKSALTDKDKSVIDSSVENIPSTYVSMRNVIFLSIACSWAESINCCNIFIGANAIDYSGYPDCREVFLDSYEKMINLGSKTGVEGGSLKIHRPLVSMSKAQIVKLGHSLGIDYKKTISCYQATDNGKACGKCESCELRKKGFFENGLPDETLYI
tara:strand:+ start:666 stop:1343 length:678 start_codon:yes stop_codon:yes gene_type:complete